MRFVLAEPICSAGVQGEAAISQLFVLRGCLIMTNVRHRALFVSTMLVAGVACATAAVAQAQPNSNNTGYQNGGYDDGSQGGQPPQGYDQNGGPPPGYNQNGGPPPQGYDQNGGQPPQGYGQPQQAYAPPPPPPPPGYDGTRPPPPPPGYQPGPEDARQAAQDQQYAAYAQQWEQANCVRAHANTGTGAVLGGAVGALLGSGLAGRHDRGAGALLGAGAGALGGAAIASNSTSNATSPGCPPGFVTRNGAPPFAYGSAYPAAPAYVYAAPAWYQPWVFYGGVWSYRPYPYHGWYARYYGRPGFYGRPGYYGHRRW
jgi:hypothetical protein